MIDMDRVRNFVGTRKGQIMNEKYIRLGD
jgi:hypothetical protein